MKDHQDLVAALVKPGADIQDTLTPGKVHLLHMALGIVTEAGELADAIKKHVMYNQPLNFDNTDRKSVV